MPPPPPSPLRKVDFILLWLLFRRKSFSLDFFKGDWDRVNRQCANILREPNIFLSSNLTATVAFALVAHYSDQLLN
jgi:hypothetical protein